MISALIVLASSPLQPVMVAVPQRLKARQQLERQLRTLTERAHQAAHLSQRIDNMPILKPQIKDRMPIFPAAPGKEKLFSRPQAILINGRQFLIPAGKHR